MHFPALFEASADGGYVITFRDIPEAITQGDNDEDAGLMAEDVLMCALEWYLESGKAIPPPTPPLDKERLVAVPPVLAEKIKAGRLQA